MDIPLRSFMRRPCRKSVFMMGYEDSDGFTVGMTGFMAEHDLRNIA
jgi:hypothetical protein